MSAASAKPPLTTEQLADLVLQAAGSSLRNYTMPKSRADILAAVDQIFAAGWEAGRDAAAGIAESTDTGWFDGRTYTAQKIAQLIRNLTPPGDQP